MGYEVPAPKPRGAADDGDGQSYERPIDRFRRGAVGGVIAAGLLGLRDALEGPPERDDIEIVGQAPQPHDGASLELVLDPEHPENSIAVIRHPRATPPTRES
ncbi:MAG TPA: hypothetical protein VGU73_01515 [Acidimicrobiia bacterium]|nr:hypothetical protein [Acidimicrobiia bacterium]